MSEDPMQKVIRKADRAEKRWKVYMWIATTAVAIPLLVGCGLAVWILAAAYL
jgi:hypothetical protein